MRDFYPEDMGVRRRIFDAWRGAARSFGFVEYDACVVESLDLLKRKAGEEIGEQIYAFTDKSGRELALRPEMTPTLARMVAARQGSLSFPLKWTTIAQCFRYERMTRGRKREHYQWNLDIIGEASVLAEAEVIGAAYSALATLGLGPADVCTRFSSRAVLSDILRGMDIAPEHHQAVFLALDKRGKLPDEAIGDLLRGEGLSPAQVDRAFGILAIRTLDEASAVAGPQSAAVEDVRSFMAHLQAAGLSDAARFDLSVIRGLSYYTGIVFEGFDTAGSLRAVFGGGRYDDLLKTVGGRPATGVGLGFGDVVIAELLAERGLCQTGGEAAAIAVGYMSVNEQRAAARLAAALRKSGESVDLALSPERAKSFFSRAARNGSLRSVYVGPDDVSAGKCRIKDMRTRQETVAPLP